MAAARLFPLDALRALAAQLIVLHHLSAYGPIAEAMHSLFPMLTGWLYDYGRMAVQVFLVLGGYLSARALSAQEQQLHQSAPALLAQRYWRLVPPFMAAVLLTLLASWLVEPLLPELVPDQVQFLQVLAHALLLHDLLGMDALTVGAWYVAIDFQLFALLLLLMWGLRWLPLRRLTRQRVLPVLVGVLCAASLLQFNRMAELDAYGIYFFGAYGLGSLLFWCQSWPARWRGVALGVLALLMVAALTLQFRERLVVAGMTAAVVALWRRGEGPVWLQVRVQGLARHAYALFLIHFPICLMVNALYEHRAENPAPMLDAMAPLALLAAWALSNVAALPFHHWVEAPLLRWRPRAATLPSGAAAR
ncbi:Peptidoglycan/LPS O-acetylase OafA/YrhL, contains acyltransferase and SGNH-hydrolase domains [Roseateles sp. YR242]|uniref:acyltransferase family protein n=1 Tax=Roseateles sp. YR242 TaxID=1855305 RepID=UPI0008AEFD49|nr:acyltransferase family protein [Roseateles sp. YR242]SEK80456.1 Peptidoglycan/LPS O-acetylase OafA/YrhL, contains acyltransferase and SGNH-hydrolase domains [Roseateles sp. YR242]